MKSEIYIYIYIKPNFPFRINKIPNQEPTGVRTTRYQTYICESREEIPRNNSAITKKLPWSSGESITIDSLRRNVEEFSRDADHSSALTIRKPDRNSEKYRDELRMFRNLYQSVEKKDLLVIRSIQARRSSTVEVASWLRLARLVPERCLLTTQVAMLAAE